MYHILLYFVILGGRDAIHYVLMKGLLGDGLLPCTALHCTVKLVDKDPVLLGLIWSIWGLFEWNEDLFRSFIEIPLRSTARKTLSLLITRRRKWILLHGQIFLFLLLTAGHCLPVNPMPPPLPTAFPHPLHVLQCAGPQPHLKEPHTINLLNHLHQLRSSHHQTASPPNSKVLEQGGGGSLARHASYPPWPHTPIIWLLATILDNICLASSPGLSSTAWNVSNVHCSF